MAAQLQAYVGNLTFDSHVVQNDWLPAIQQHLAALRQHLADAGHPEDDGFLLRLGLVVLECGGESFLLRRCLC